MFVFTDFHPTASLIEGFRGGTNEHISYRQRLGKGVGLTGKGRPLVKSTTSDSGIGNADCDGFSRAVKCKTIKRREEYA